MAGSPEYRFALGVADQPQSLVWRLWTLDDEMHLSVATGDGAIALTAYPTGRWRIDVNGVMSRWHRPKEFRPGWTRGPDIVLPGGLASDPVPAVPTKKAAPPINWLEPPAKGHQTRAQLWFATPGAEQRGWRRAASAAAEALTILTLRRAGTVHLIRDDEPVEGDDASSTRPKTRAVAVRADQTGRPSFWETLT